MQPVAAQQQQQQDTQCPMSSQQQTGWKEFKQHRGLAFAWANATQATQLNLGYCT
jgi:hypothetical protein